MCHCLCLQFLPHDSVLSSLVDSPCIAGSTAAGKEQGLQQPAWVKARAATSMRVLQRAADKGLSAGPPPSSWLGSQGGRSVGSAAFEEAPWMGHGGVRHMDAGHLGGFTNSLMSACLVSHASCITTRLTRDPVNLLIVAQCLVACAVTNTSVSCYVLICLSS